MHETDSIPLHPLGHHDSLFLSGACNVPGGMSGDLVFDMHLACYPVPQQATFSFIAIIGLIHPVWTSIHDLSYPE